jgi:solute carrier family 6 serotonin transporter-like protein 4
VFYLFASFSVEMPWSSCNNEWNTPLCLDQVKSVEGANATLARIAKMTQDGGSLTSPAEEYFNRRMLGIQWSTGIDNLGPIKWDLTVCLFLVYLLMYVCICKGVKSTGKAVYVTAVLPYVILVVLLIHGLTLAGSQKGVSYFLTPTFDKLSDFECWKDAAIQIFFTLGPGISVLTTYASYSKFNNNCQIDAICASVANVIASFLSGIVVFASLGHLSYHVGKPIHEVTRSDLGLSFIAYPEILSTFKYSAFYSIIFFLMIINLGLDSGFGGLEAIYTALADEFTVIKKYRKSSMALIHFVLFLGSLPTVTYGGMYLVTFLDTFSTSPALMLIVFFECVSVSWIYGVELFSENINKMFGVRPNRFWTFCWKFASPAIIIGLFFISIFMFEDPVVDNYKYPFGFLIAGWIINISVMTPIPVYAAYKCFTTSNVNVNS